MQRRARITEANTTIPGLRICLLGWLHRNCTVGLLCHDVTAFTYLRFKQRLSFLEVPRENCLSIISQVSRAFLISPSCLSTVSPHCPARSISGAFLGINAGMFFCRFVQQSPWTRGKLPVVCYNRVLSSLFSFVPLIVPSPDLILEPATPVAAAAAAASAAHMSIRQGSFVSNTPESHTAGGLAGLCSLDTLLLCNAI